MTMRVARMNHGKRVKYQLRDDDDKMLANFDSLSAAGAVLRYLTGGNMSDEERGRAFLAMAMVDSEQAARHAGRGD